MGSEIGALKTAARRVGLSVGEYSARVAAGQKWCCGCRAWHQRALFGVDPSKGDGLMSRCRMSRARRFKETYVPIPPELQRTGGPEVPARDGDRRQARRRVNHLVDIGVLPRPNDVPCADCGHVRQPGGRRHEYDHHLGYGADHHEDVEAVCSTCHAARERARGTYPNWRAKAA